MVESGVEEEREKTGPLSHGLSNLTLFVEEFVQFEPLVDAFHVHFGPAQLLPVVVFGTLLFLDEAELGSGLEYVLDQRVAAHFAVAHLNQIIKSVSRIQTRGRFNPGWFTLGSLQCSGQRTRRRLQ